MKLFQKMATFNMIRSLRLAAVGQNVIILSALALLIGLNILVSLFPIRIDLSNGKAYTLSSATKKIVRNVADTVDVKLYVSSDLPPALAPTKTQVVDMLQEFHKLSGKIRVQVLDPKKDQKVLQEAQEAGLTQLQFSEQGQDQLNVVSSFFGIVLSYQGKSELIQQATDTTMLEYELSNAIFKLSRSEPMKIGIFGMKSDDPQKDPIGAFRKVFQDQFTLTSIDVTEKTPSIDPSMQTVVIFDDNKKKFSDADLAALKTYLNRGGKLLVFADGVWVAQDLSKVDPADHNLFSFLNEYGLTLNRDLVLSNSSEMVNFGNGTVSFYVPYPLWLKTNVYNPQSTYFTNIPSLSFPWASSIRYKKTPGVQVQPLVLTPKRSWHQTENFVVSPRGIPNPTASQQGQFVLAADAKLKQGGELVLFSSSRFIQNEYLSQAGESLGLTLNILTDLASNGALSGIRSRAATVYPLPDFSSQEKDQFKYFVIFLLPVLFALFGGIRLVRRNK
ncbi:GldG family protein [Candidatus Roizmanbacteria bacterium]|nr:GldG family protein [Candidatus Roizmanbacteria bacterium]